MKNYSKRSLLSLSLSSAILTACGGGGGGSAPSVVSSPSSSSTSSSTSSSSSSSTSSSSSSSSSQTPVIVNIMAGIDSLTNGADGASYLTGTNGLKAQLRVKYGDAGEGYARADGNGNGTLAERWTGYGWGHSPNVTEFQALAWGAQSNNASRNNAPFGGGVFSGPTANSTDYAFWGSWTLAQQPYDVGSVTFYIELLTASASMKLVAVQNVVGATVTSSSYAVGKILQITIAVAAGKPCFVGFNPLGECALYGFTLNPRVAVSGVTIANLGTGGTELANWFGQDDSRVRQIMTWLTPNLWLFNAGMNDRITVSPALFLSQLTTVCAQLTSAGSKMLLITPDDSSDAATSNLQAYAAQRQALATSKGYSYFDVRSLTGFSTYAAAQAAGYMYDAVHPNPAGDQVIANGLYSYLLAHGLA